MAERELSQSNPEREALLPELWFEVIAFLSVQDLLPLSKCSRTLRNISTPVLFRTFIVHPFAIQDPNQRIIRRSLAAMGIRMPGPEDCLQILGQPHIAQVIETFAILPPDITPRTLHHVRYPVETLTELGSLIDQIFQLLPSLPKLRRLVCAHFSLTEERVDTLIRLPLKRLQLQLCTLPAISPVVARAPGTLESVALVFMPGSWDHIECSAAHVSLFTALFSSPNLKSIHSVNLNTILLCISQSPPPSLTKLHLPIECATSRYLIPALKLCGSLQSLSFTCRHGRASYNPMPQLPPGSLPNLESFAGPAEYLPNFIQGTSSLKHVHLIHTEFVQVPASSIHLIHQTIESFTCSSALVGPFFFPTIHSHFASSPLKNLTLVSRALEIRESLKDPTLSPFPGMRQFRARVVTGSWNDREFIVNHFGEYVPLLLRLYPGLEEAEFVHPMLDKTQLIMAWNRKEAGRDDDGNIGMALKVLEIEESEAETS
ncbi:hypothetical protein BDN72DRAFT_841103 [Pluteus cervinus]|uniref:Uncharacterized protein n=1 Tax=Pluteus cervinus TaxID=181527 RepID=A0ACD3ATG3_9AGAR|nr:hypothetical protein BDN72DRAFT_841103 [Pluteus cervinus]